MKSNGVRSYYVLRSRARSKILSNYANVSRDRKHVEAEESERIPSERKQALVPAACSAIASGILSDRELIFLREYIQLGKTMRSVTEKNDAGKMYASQIVAAAAKKIRKGMGITSIPAGTVAA